MSGGVCPIPKPFVRRVFISICSVEGSHGPAQGGDDINRMYCGVVPHKGASNVISSSKLRSIVFTLIDDFL